MTQQVSSRSSLALLLSIQQPRAPGAPRRAPTSSLFQPLLSLYRAAPRRGGLPPEAARLFSPSIEQPRAGSSLPKQLPPTLNRAAPRSGITPRKQPPPSIKSSSPRSGSSPQKQPLLSLCYQTALRSGSSPAPKQPLLSLYQTSPRSGSSPRSSLFSPSIKQPCAA